MVPTIRGAGSLPADGVQRYPEGSLYRLGIESPGPKPGWRPRTTGDRGHQPFPGTALLFEGTFWEVVQYQPASAAGTRHRYFLNPWDDRHPLRAPLEYSPTIGEAHAQAMREAEQRAAVARLLRVSAPLVALLPARDQRRLETELGYPATRSTGISAAVVGAASVVGVLFAFWASRNPEAPQFAKQLASLQPIAVYLFLESLVRLYSSMIGGEPLGSALVALPLAAARALATRRSGPAPARIPTAMSAQQLAHLEDRTVELAGTAGQAARLEVRSLLPKPHWTLNRTGIRYRDHWYLLIERSESDGGNGQRYHFVLEEIEPQSWFTTYCEYRPDEVRGLLVEQLRRARATWVETLAPVWGLLEGHDKRRLAARYDFDPDASTRTSILGTGALSVILVAVAITAVMAGKGQLLRDLGSLVVGGYFLYESIVRWREYDRGELPGSVLARVLRPLARPLFAVPARPQPDSSAAR